LSRRRGGRRPGRRPAVLGPRGPARASIRSAAGPDGEAPRMVRCAKGGGWRRRARPPRAIGPSCRPHRRPGLAVSRGGGSPQSAPVSRAPSCPAQLLRRTSQRTILRNVCAASRPTCMLVVYQRFGRGRRRAWVVRPPSLDWNNSTGCHRNREGRAPTLVRSLPGPGQRRTYERIDPAAQSRAYVMTGPPTTRLRCAAPMFRGSSATCSVRGTIYPNKSIMCGESGARRWAMRTQALG
jgi:hypothetical protein